MTQAVIPISSLSILKVTGSDAETFLQGQLTNDVSKLEHTWSFAGYCSPKGRLLAIFKIWQQQDAYFLLLPTELSETIQKRLTMYVLRSKVALEKIDSNIYGIIGKQYTDDIAQRFEISLANNTIASSGTNTILKVSDRDSFLITSGTLPMESYQHKPESIWLEADIDRGHPQIYTETSDMFVPQMVNLDILNGISFKKGCYTGQEIVARMHYLGKLKQRMYKIKIEGPSETIDIADILNTKDEKNAGNIISILKINEQTSALAVIRKEFLDQPLTVNGVSIQIDKNAQPYEIE